MGLSAQDLDTRIRQMHSALENVSAGTAEALQAEVIPIPGGHYYRLDCSKLRNQFDLRNSVELLTANIARLKDHLKEWCSKNGKPFEGDTLINSNRAVAIVHDLWNLDKHAALNHPPRSGCLPRLAGLRTELNASSGKDPEKAMSLSFDATGKLIINTPGDGFSAVRIIADIQDENGAPLGSLEAICEEAIAQWEGALTRAGVQVPKR